MCEEQVHLNSHILTALAQPQRTYFHNNSNKNKCTSIYNKAWKMHLADGL